MRIAHLIIGFGLLALVLSGCATRQAAGVPAGSELENDFELVLYQGADVLGSESIQFSKVLAQGKPVVLIMPLLEAAGADYGDEVLIMACTEDIAVCRRLFSPMARSWSSHCSLNWSAS